MTGEEKEADRLKYLFQEPYIPFPEVSSPKSQITGKLPDEKPFVSAWWDEFMPYYKTSDIDRMLPMIYAFLREHPQDFFDLGLHEECLYELAPAMDKVGRYDEYISLLEKIRIECPDTYLSSFGAFDSAMIEYNISLGHDADISPYLQNFIRRPDRYPDYLSEVLDALSITGRQDELKALVEPSALAVLNSKDVIGGGFVADKLPMLYYNPFISAKDCSDEAALSISEKLNASGLFVDGIGKDDILRHLENYINYNVPFDPVLLSCKNKESLFYQDLGCRFTGFLAHELGCSLTASHLMSEMVVEYLWNLVFERKNKSPLDFNSRELDSFISRNNSIFLYVRSIPSMAILQGIIYFHRYLNHLHILPVQDIGKITDEATELAELVKKAHSESLSCVERIFRTFPEFKGRVDRDAG